MSQSPTVGRLGSLLTRGFTVVVVAPTVRPSSLTAQ
jgi:hypothetical protein